MKNENLIQKIYNDSEDKLKNESKILELTDHIKREDKIEVVAENKKYDFIEDIEEEEENNII